jgi:hypothetical protein
LGLNVPQSTIAIGVPAYATPPDNTLWHALLLPFGRQRDYWRRGDGTRVERDRAAASENLSRLAE